MFVLIAMFGFTLGQVFFCSGSTIRLYTPRAVLGRCGVSHHPLSDDLVLSYYQTVPWIKRIENKSSPGLVCMGPTLHPWPWAEDLRNEDFLKVKS